MGKGSVSLPKPPSYFEDPNFMSGVDQLLGLGGKLTNFDFSGSLSPLQDVININPDMLKGFFSSLQPYYNQMRRGTMNELAATNQLESSVTTNRLGQIDTDIANTLQGYTSQMIQQALQNRITLFGTGLNTISGATGYAGQNQGQRNQFNLNNYENQVAKTLFDSSQAGFWGNLLSNFSPVAHDIYTAQGKDVPGMGVNQTAMTVLGMGQGLGGGGSSGTMGNLSYRPGSTASNNPFGTMNTQDLVTKYPYLFGGLNYN